MRWWAAGALARTGSEMGAPAPRASSSVLAAVPHAIPGNRSEWAWVLGSATLIRMQGAPWRRSANGSAKPMVPPAPTMAVSVLKLALRAARAASKAARSGPAVHHGVVPLIFAVTFTP